MLCSLVCHVDYCAAVPYYQQCHETGVWYLAKGHVSDVTDATIELYWLLICVWIAQKLCLIVHQALNCQLPSYTAELLQPVTTR